MLIGRQHNVVFFFFCVYLACVERKNQNALLVNQAGMVTQPKPNQPKEHKVDKTQKGKAKT